MRAHLNDSWAKTKGEWSVEPAPPSRAGSEREMAPAYPLSTIACKGRQERHTNVGH